jgi:hypothetical protein
MTDIRIINPIEFEGWDNVIAPLPGSSFFHSTAWAKVLSESYNYKPTYFTFFRDDKVVGLIPVMEVNSILTGKRGVSLPFTDYCEPIIDKDLQFHELFHNIIDYGDQKKWKYFEIRGGQHSLPDIQASQSYLRHTLFLLNSPEEIFRTFNRGTKSVIKKSEKEGIEINISKAEDSIIEFYKLNCITRKLHGLPPQPESFFRNVYRYILKEELGVVILASYRNSNIAGCVFFNFGDKAIYKYGASKREYQNLRANNLIMWNAIKYYLEKGCTTFCFGRTEPENDGLRQFKNGWGTQEHVLNYYKYDLHQARYIHNQEIVSRFQSMAFGKLPIPLLKIIGKYSYRHVG